MHLLAPYPLYNFLGFCNRSPLEKVILDCGAGGSAPPLSLFLEHGYKTCGIEISQVQLAESNRYCAENNIELNITLGNMLKLPYKDESFSFLYSYNTSVHMKKVDFAIAVSEFSQVLKAGGLCYVNFLSCECDTYGQGVQLGPGEYESEGTLFSHYEDTEPETMFGNFDVIYMEKRTVKRKCNTGYQVSGYHDYILKK